MLDPRATETLLRLIENSVGEITRMDERHKQHYGKPSEICAYRIQELSFAREELLKWTSQSKPSGT